MNPLATKYLNVRPAVVIDSNGRLVPGMAVDFSVGDGPVHTLTLPQAGFTAQVAKAAVEKLAQEIRSTLQ